MLQSPMLSAPLKQTSEIDWVLPLKGHIRDNYGDDPDKYTEECVTLNRLRQDMRGAGKDSAAGRDLLYRYYGQLELLDLRFPVDENHIKIQFTWFDAFTHRPTSQYSLAFEKASIIFNISAVLSCHAANQDRSDETGLKTAYHSFQASAGMFNYINENFLHAPSVDLSRETVKTMMSIMLAQGQEVFLEKQIADGKKAALLAKLASQAASLYAQAVDGTSENVAKGVFDKVWLLMVQFKASYMGCLAQYYQSIADSAANQHGVAIARLAVADTLAKDASRVASSIPSSVPASANLSSEAIATLVDMVKRHLALVLEKLEEMTKDNDFIYHQTIPGPAALGPVSKLPAAKPIPVSELYQGQDIQRIIGPDIFQKIVPLAVTESSSLYDEEKAKLVRAESEKAEAANGEMAASLDYLKLPASLDVLKNGADHGPGSVDDEFRNWCNDLASHEPFHKAFDQLQADKRAILATLDACTKQLDLEENVCEKMRVKYDAAWTQQPSSRLNATLRADLRAYRATVDEAAGSDAQLLATARQFDADFDEMRSAGETGEADVLYHSAMTKVAAGGGGTGSGSGNKNRTSNPQEEGSLLDEDYDESGPSVMEQIAAVEDLLKRLQLIKKDRMTVLKDLKEKAHNDDISNALILNKKSPGNETRLFEAELEKFRSHQNRLLQANHKQSSLLKELTHTYSHLLQDKRVRSEQTRYEAFHRQRSAVMSRYRKVYQAFTDLVDGLLLAQSFYSEMTDTVDNLEKNVTSFVNNRREEGSQLLANMDITHATSTTGHADHDQDRLRERLERMTMTASPPRRTRSSASRATPLSRPSQAGPTPTVTTNYPYAVSTAPTSPPYFHNHLPTTALPAGYAIPASHSPNPVFAGYHGPSPYGPPATAAAYEPMQYPYQARLSPAHPHLYSMSPAPGMYSTPVPQGYVPPPPPPGPPPPSVAANAAGAGGVGQPTYPYGPPSTQRPPGNGTPTPDPWAGLGAWK